MVSVEIFITVTLSCSIAFTLVGGFIGLVCGIKCTSRKQVARSMANASHVLSATQETPLRRVQYDFTENVAYATVKASHTQQT